MRLAVHVPSLVLAACILVTAAIGASLGALWLGLLGIGAAMQITALWRRYRQ